MDEIKPYEGELEQANLNHNKLKIEYNKEDEEDIKLLIETAEQQIKKDFAQPIKIENDLLEKVRVEGLNGYTRDTNGAYLESWNRLSVNDMEQFIHAASSAVFFNTQKVINSYADASFAKYIYDDAYSDTYSVLNDGTIADKEAISKKYTQQERWVALYKTIYYKKAKEIIDKLENHIRRVEKIYQEKQKEIDREFRASRQQLYTDRG